MAEAYTHIYELEINGKYIKGDVEFNLDKQMTYNVKHSSDPFDNEMMQYFIDFMVRFFARGYRAVEIPYHAPPRRFGASKTNVNIFVLLSHGLTYAWTVCRIFIEKTVGYL